MAGLPALYEREAYLVHTLALRITCDAAAAADAVEQAFLTLAAEGGAAWERAVTAALPRAVVGGSGDGLLGVTAGLAPPLRAALAVAALCGEDALSTALGLSPIATRSVLVRARRELAGRLGADEAAAAGAYADWDWAAPPEALWPRVHEAVYRALAAPPAAAAVAEEAPAPPRRRRRLARPLVIVFFGGLCAVAGAAGTAWLSRAEAPRAAAEAAAAPGTAAAAATPVASDALSPQDLDQLRMDELRDLKRYARAAADQDLAPQKRRRADARLRRLAERARSRRQAGERRATARRRALAQREAAAKAEPERDRSGAAPAPLAPVEEDAEAVPVEDEPEAQPEPEPEPDDEQPSADREDCLYDQENGVYVCPGD